MARYKAQKFKTCTARGSQCHGDNLPSGASIEHTARGRRRARRHGLGSATARQAAHQKPVWGKQRKLCDASLPPAQRMPGPTGLNLLQLLERRLDNVVYRLGFARTPPMSRQVVGHGRVLVNAKPVNIPSFRVKAGDLIRLTDTAREIPVIKVKLGTRPTTSCLGCDGARHRNAATNRYRRRHSRGSVRRVVRLLIKLGTSLKWPATSLTGEPCVLGTP